MIQREEKKERKKEEEEEGEESRRKVSLLSLSPLLWKEEGIALTVT